MTDGGSSVAEHRSDQPEGTRFDPRPPYQKGKLFGWKWGEYLGKRECPYVRRWVIVLLGFSVRLHHFYRSDDDRAAHDHPWWFVTLILRGAYWDCDGEGGIEHMTPGTIRYRPALHRHSVIVDRTSRHARGDGVWTLIVTGQHRRRWGFWLRRDDGTYRFKKSNKYFLEHGHPPCDYL